MTQQRAAQNHSDRCRDDRDAHGRVSGVSTDEGYFSYNKLERKNFAFVYDGEKRVLAQRSDGAIVVDVSINVLRGSPYSLDFDQCEEYVAIFVAIVQLATAAFAILATVSLYSFNHAAGTAGACFLCFVST